MRLITLLLFSLLILASWTRANAQSDDASGPDSLILTDEQDEYPLGLHLEILEDPGGELTIAEVASPEFDSRFVASDSEVPNYGFTGSAYWVRQNLRNESRSTDHWLLEVGFANMQFVDLYAPLPDSEGFAVKQSGSLRHASTRDILHREVVFELTLPSQSQQTYYLRFKNDASMTLQLTAWSESAFLARVQQDLLQYGLFFGVMVGLLGYNLFLFFSLREKSYLFLILFIANMIFFEVSYSGILETLALPNLYSLKPFYLPLSFSLIFVWALLFCHSFLEVQARIRILHRVIIAILAVWGVLMILIPIISYRTLALLVVPLAILSLVTILAAGIISWRQGYRAARFFMFAWLALVVTLLIVLLVRFGLVSSTGISENAYHLGLMWMVVCWSIAQADRINVLKADTEEANRDLRSSERRLAQILEGLPLGVTVYGKDHKPSFANRRVTEILGNPAQDIKPDLSAGRTLSEAMNYYSIRVAGSDQDYPLEEMPIYRALQGQSASIDDAEADLVDRRVPLEIWASPVRDDAGDVEAAVVAFQDISARNRAEMALSASEKKFRVIVENNFDGVVFMAHDRQVLYVSPSYERLSGLTAKETLGQYGVDFVHPDDQARIAQVFAELLQRPGGRTTVEYRSKHKDGSWIWVETNALNLLEDPHVEAVVLNIRNITERKRTEIELAEYREKLELLVDERTAELNAINETLSVEVARRNRLEQLQHERIAWLTILSEINHTVKGSSDIGPAFDRLAARMLQIFRARIVFILDWGGDREQIQSLAKVQGEELSVDLNELGALFKDGSPFRTEIEQNNLVHIPADQTDSLPGPLREFLPDSHSGRLLIARLKSEESVVGVLGIKLPQQSDDLSRVQDALVEDVSRDLSRLAEDAKRLDQSRALVAAEERNRLARDLHDSVTQVLFSASLVAAVLPQIWRRNPERAMESLEQVRRLTHGALAEMRTMLLELRPSSLLKTPLPELLAQLTEAITTRSEIVFQLSIEQIPSLPDDVHVSFYRIAQEALNNVVKHAQASRVLVNLSQSAIGPDSTGLNGHQVKLIIEDDGVGFSPGTTKADHIGLGIMNERAGAIDAQLFIDSQVGAGTQVILIWHSEPDNTP